MTNHADQTTHKGKKNREAKTVYPRTTSSRGAGRRAWTREPARRPLLPPGQRPSSCRSATAARPGAGRCRSPPPASAAPDPRPPPPLLARRAVLCCYAGREGGRGDQSATAYGSISAAIQSSNEERRGAGGGSWWRRRERWKCGDVQIAPGARRDVGRRNTMPSSCVNSGPITILPLAFDLTCLLPFGYLPGYHVIRGGRCAASTRGHTFV